MVISASPTSAALSVAHRLASLFLSPFLGSMLDFLGEGGMEDSLEKDDLTDISGMSQSTLIWPSEVEVAGDEEYLEDEGNYWTSCYLPAHLPFELLASHFALWTTYVVLLCKMKLPPGLI